VDELVRSSPFHWELRVRSKGVWTSRLQLTDESFLGAPFPLPPLPEQAAIVRFLDHADRKIFRYIRAKQMLIKLLEEQKQVISHRAVTRGLNPNVRLKASGVEWLGDVPEHWDVTRVKNEFFCLNRRRIPLSATERGAMTLRRYDYFGASGAIDKVAEYLFDDDLLLIAEDGANLVLRNLPLAILARGKFWVNNHAHILKPKRGSLEYLAGVMECINYQPWISGAAQPKLTMDRLMSVTIAVAPPPEEQEQIVKVQNEETGPLRAAIKQANREITLLREYRTRLIADLVTGKLDVREAASQLPDEDQELPLIDGLDEVNDPENDAVDDLDEAPEDSEP
jgi:type I restriction enzyme, S subunit